MAQGRARGDTSSGAGSGPLPRGKYLTPVSFNRSWYTPSGKGFLTTPRCNYSVSNILSQKDKNIEKVNLEISDQELRAQDLEFRQRLAVLSHLDWTTATAIEFSKDLPKSKDADKLKRLLLSSAKSVSFLAGSETFSLENNVLRRRDHILNRVITQVPVEEVSKLRAGPIVCPSLFQEEELTRAVSLAKSETQHSVHRNLLDQKPKTGASSFSNYKIPKKGKANKPTPDKQSTGSKGKGRGSQPKKSKGKGTYSKGTGKGRRGPKQGF